MMGDDLRVCKTPGCPGDGRYAPPGRGHNFACTEAWSAVAYSLSALADPAHESNFTDEQFEAHRLVVATEAGLVRTGTTPDDRAIYAAPAPVPDDEVVDQIARLLFGAWERADPSTAVAQYPASYMATFADLARAVLDSDWLAQHTAAAVDAALAQQREGLERAWDEGACEALRLHDQHKAWMLTNPYRAPLVREFGEGR